MYSKLGFTKNAEIIASKIEITKTISFFAKEKSWEIMIFDSEVCWIASIIKKNGPSGNRTRLSTLRGSRTKPIFDGTKKYSEKSENETKKAEQKKCSALVPHGGFEPPQSEPESDVLPLHKRGMGEFNIHFFGVSVNAVSQI